MIISRSRAHHARVALLDSERGKHTGRDVVLDTHRPKNVDHVLEIASIIELKDCITFVDGIDKAMLRWVAASERQWGRMHLAYLNTPLVIWH